MKAADLLAKPHLVVTGREESLARRCVALEDELNRAIAIITHPDWAPQLRNVKAFVKDSRELLGREL